MEIMENLRRVVPDQGDEGIEDRKRRKERGLRRNEGILRQQGSKWIHHGAFPSGDFECLNRLLMFFGI